jgi:hypothetical protein
VPLVITVPPDAVDKIKFLTFWSELSDRIQEMEDASIKRLAAALDIPLEVLTGMGDTSHWNAWAIAEDTVRIFIEPVLQRIAEALDHGYLDSALEEMGLDPQRYTFAFDTAPLTVKPNRGPEALQLNAAGLLDDETTLKENGYSDEQKQQPEERVRHLIEQALPQKPELLAEPVILRLLGLDPKKFAPEGALQPAPGAPGGPPTPPELPAGPGQQTNEQAPRSAPQNEADATGGTQNAPATTAAAPASPGPALLFPMANLAMVRALGVAGSRIVPHRERDRWPGTPKHELHVRFGPITQDRANNELRGVWEDLEAAMASDVFDARRLQTALHEMAVDLLMRGTAYDKNDLRTLLVAVWPHLLRQPVAA